MDELGLNKLLQGFCLPDCYFCQVFNLAISSYQNKNSQKMPMLLRLRNISNHGNEGR